ncbi:MAG: hypothetical protein ACRD50_00945 [Candidatus Acidiferrales bacterium]
MDLPTKTAPALEDAVARALRDNLPSLQRTAEELQQAFQDLVSACASNRPSNALPAMLRAETASASLARSLEVLASFVTAALQPRERSAAEVTLLRAVEAEARPAEEPRTAPEFAPAPMDRNAAPASAVEAQISRPPTVNETDLSSAAPRVEEPSASWDASPPASDWETLAHEPAVEELSSPAASHISADASFASPLEHVDISEEALEADFERATAEAAFDVSQLPASEQELHRRANRIAKVAMQDIKLLKPEEVRAGCEHRDLCARLRNEIDKARKEYDRRFKDIQDHPVDYFHQWMVEILAEGDAEALGEYPYPSPALHR